MFFAVLKFIFIRETLNDGQESGVVLEHRVDESGSENAARLIAYY